MISIHMEMGMKMSREDRGMKGEFDGYLGNGYVMLER